MNRSIRLRITTVAATAMAAVLLVTAAALLVTQQRVLTANLDDSLETAAADLAQTHRTGTLPRLLPTHIDDDAITQVVTLDGVVLAANARFTNQPALPPPTADHDLRTVSLFPAEPGYRLYSQRAGDVIIHTGAPIDDITESVATLRLALAVTLPLVVAVLAALTWWLVGRTLRPVEAIRRQVADITTHNLHRRVPEPATTDEIQRLARTMNDMLDRLHTAAQRQQRFVADASHELRSPLTRIRTELEVDLLHPDTADPTATHHSVLHETRQLQTLIDDLLLLARHDATTPQHHRIVQLDDLVFNETRQLHPNPTITIDTTNITPVQVNGDANQLARSIRNLLDNAARYTTTTIAITLTQTDNRARLTITDDGPGIDPTHRNYIFQRFTRLDPARTHNTTTNGTGLGLAIAHDIITTHHGTITLDPHPGPGATFTIELPTANPKTAAPNHPANPLSQ